MMQTSPKKIAGHPSEGLAAGTVCPVQAAATPSANLLEMADLRTRPYIVPPDHLTYRSSSKPLKRNHALPIGAQTRFIDATVAAAQAGFALNTLLTRRWNSLFSDEDVNWLRALPPPERIAQLMQRLRKWLARRSLPAMTIWVREAADCGAEHLHLALHLPARLRAQFAGYIAYLTGEAASKKISRQHSLGEFARGEIGSWQLACDHRPDRAGSFLGAYLGKAEPSQRLFRGTLRNNVLKQVRGAAFGGQQRDGRYDADQGQIIGTTTRYERFHISKPLQALCKKRAEHDQ